MVEEKCQSLILHTDIHSFLPMESLIDDATFDQYIAFYRIMA